MEVFTEYREEIFSAFWTTIQLTVFSAIGALVIGTALAAMRLAPVPADDHHPSRDLHARREPARGGRLLRRAQRVVRSLRRGCSVD